MRVRHFGGNKELEELVVINYLISESNLVKPSFSFVFLMQKKRIECWVKSLFDVFD
jgi:hypothetical protein